MKYLVLGSSSFYGSNFVKLLKEKGEEVTGLSRPKWKLGDKIPKADVVVNFASRSLVAESWKDPQGWLMTNAVKTTKLLEQLRGMKCLFIHVSTPEVYGHNPNAVQEGHPFNPSTPYAVSRAAGDMMVAAYTKAYGLDTIITRTANIYGLGQPDYRFIPHAFKTLRAGKELGLDGGGFTTRGFIHVKDACEATYLLVKRGKRGETYHIAPVRVLSIASLAHMIWERVRKGTIVAKPERLGKDLAYILHSNKIRRLGWKDNITLDEGLDEYGH